MKRQTGLSRRIVTVAMALLAVAVVAACGAAPPVPNDNFYRLQAVAARAPFAAPVFPGVLEVERFSADGVKFQVSLPYNSTA